MASNLPIGYAEMFANPDQLRADGATQRPNDVAPVKTNRAIPTAKATSGIAKIYAGYG